MSKTMLLSMFSVALLSVGMCFCTAYGDATNVATVVQSEKYFERGHRFSCGGMPIVEVYGSWRQMGRQYGFLMRDELKKVYDFAMKNPEGVAEYVGQFGIDGSICGLRRYDELFAGVAETSGLTLEQLSVVNSVELIYLNMLTDDELRRIQDASRCSSLAVSEPFSQELYFGRNYDWITNFAEIADTLVVGIFHPADGANAVAMLNWAGCLYVTTAMNAQGLFLELNSGMFADTNVRPGQIHNVWLLWEFALNSDSFNALKGFFATSRSTTGYLVGASDGSQVEVFEWHTKGSYNLAPHDEPGLIAAANHYTTPGWENLPNAGMTNCYSSIQRRQNLRDLAKKYRAENTQIDLASMIQIMDTPAQDGGAKINGTMFQVIAIPARQIWHVRTRSMDHWVEIPMKELLSRTRVPSGLKLTVR